MGYINSFGIENGQAGAGGAASDPFAGLTNKTVVALDDSGEAYSPQIEVDWFNPGDVHLGDYRMGNTGIHLSQFSDFIDINSVDGAEEFQAYLCGTSTPYFYGNTGFEMWFDSFKFLTYAGVETGRFDATLGADSTALLLKSNGAMKRVSLGAADSGGAGFRQLIVPN
jgi:hypothetical protein